MLFDICQMLNEINRGYSPQKGTKGVLKHEDTKFFLQDDRDLGGGGRLAGVAGQHPGDQDSFGLCGASGSPPNPP